MCKCWHMLNIVNVEGMFRVLYSSEDVDWMSSVSYHHYVIWLMRAVNFFFLSTSRFHDFPVGFGSTLSRVVSVFKCYRTASFIQHE